MIAGGGYLTATSQLRFPPLLIGGAHDQRAGVSQRLVG